MSSTPSGPRGLGDLQYRVTQVSLVVSDLESTIATYQRAFGWRDWKVFDQVEPTHHGTELRGVSVPYSLRSAQVMVGGLNFELVQPLDGPSLWKEYLEEHGQGLASIAVMCDTPQQSEIVKAEFDRLGVGVTMRALIGDHNECYFLDTQDRFGCLIASGSGHAFDLAIPSRISNPPPDSPKPRVAYDHISAILVVVHDLEAKMKQYHEAFGWEPWQVYQADGNVIMHDCQLRGEPHQFFNIRWAEVNVGGLTFELVQPVSGDSPAQRVLDAQGEGIGGIAIMFKTDAESAAVREQFAHDGIGTTYSGRIGSQIEWYYLDSDAAFKCRIESGNGHAVDLIEPLAVYP
jgi:methylmalonyl-CoA/ethylmalonyl-CoA epimerase